jgi:hypothetical protein
MKHSKSSANLIEEGEEEEEEVIKTDEHKVKHFLTHLAKHHPSMFLTC